MGSRSRFMINIIIVLYIYIFFSSSFLFYVIFFFFSLFFSFLLFITMTPNLPPCVLRVAENLRGVWSPQTQPSRLVPRPLLATSPSSRFLASPTRSSSTGSLPSKRTARLQVGNPTFLLTLSSLSSLLFLFVF